MYFEVGIDFKPQFFSAHNQLHLLGFTLNHFIPDTKINPLGIYQFLANGSGHVRGDLGIYLDLAGNNFKSCPRVKNSMLLLSADDIGYAVHWALVPAQELLALHQRG